MASGRQLNDTPEQAITVVLAEFQALRTEMVSRASSAAALVGVGLTAFGVIVGFGIKSHGDLKLLLAIPPIAALVNLLWSIESKRVTLAGAYIRQQLWPALRTWLDTDLPCWEDVNQYRRTDRWRRFASLLTDGLMLLMFSASGAAALIVANNNVHIPAGVLAAEWGVVALSLALPVGIAITNLNVSVEIVSEISV